VAPGETARVGLSPRNAHADWCRFRRPGDNPLEASERFEPGYDYRFEIRPH
jgi:hypothetical protein